MAAKASNVKKTGRGKAANVANNVAKSAKAALGKLLTKPARPAKAARSKVPFPKKNQPRMPQQRRQAFVARPGSVSESRSRLKPLSGRAALAHVHLQPYRLKKNLPAADRTAPALVTKAHAFLGDPSLTAGTAAALRGFVDRAMKDADENWKKTEYPTLIENALRQLVAISPDLQTC